MKQNIESHFFKYRPLMQIDMMQKRLSDLWAKSCCDITQQAFGSVMFSCGNAARTFLNLKTFLLRNNNNKHNVSIKTNSLINGKNTIFCTGKRTRDLCFG